MLMETRCCKVLFPKCAKITSASYVWEKRGKNVCVLNFIYSRGCTRRNLYFRIENRQYVDQKHLTRRYCTVHLRSRYRINPRPTRFVSGKANFFFPISILSSPFFFSPPPGRNSDPWSHRRLFPPFPLRFVPCSVIARRFQLFLPRRFASNCAHPS